MKVLLLLSFFTFWFTAQSTDLQVNKSGETLEKEDGPLLLNFARVTGHLTNCTKKDMAERASLHLQLKEKQKEFNDIEAEYTAEMKKCPVDVTKKPKADLNYVYTPGIGTYKLYVGPQPWNGARKICLGDGGHLATINSEREAKHLASMLRKENSSEAWIGVHDQFEEGDWVTVFGEPTSWRRWNNGQPDNAPSTHDGGRTTENCGVLTTRGVMSDYACYLTMAYICEIYGAS